MDTATNNAMYAVWLSGEVEEILERDASNKAWSLVDKRKLPAQSFLWIEDRSKRSTWHLPYREGAGGIDPETGMYRQAGPVNLNALRAISQAIGGARTGKPMSIPKEIRSKIRKLLKEFNIGEFAESREGIMDFDFLESTIEGQFIAENLDKENRMIKNVLILNATSKNLYFPGSKGTRFSADFLKQIAENITGKKVYKNHVSAEEMKKHRGVRNVDDYLGHYENGRMDVVNGVPRADIKYLPHQATFVESIMEDADMVGLSIVANGAMSYDKQTGIAEAFSLKKLHSADLVTDPGSTNNMFESRNTEIEEEDDMDLTKLTFTELSESRPDIVAGIKKSIEEKTASKEEVDSLSTKIKELTETNKAQAKTIDDFKVKDSVAVKNEKIAELLKDSKIPDEFISETFRKNLSEAKDEDAMKALIEDRKELVKGKKPKKQVKDAGGSTKIDESDDENKLSDEDFEKAITEAANSRG